MFGEVPTLPIVVPLAIGVLVTLLRHLRRQGLLSAPRVLVAVVLCVYAGGGAANTIFPIFLDKPTRVAVPWHSYINIMPVAGYEAADAAMNVVVFVPLGVLMPLVLATRSSWRFLVTISGLSIVIEMTQYVTAHLFGGGHIADVNDFGFNVVGAALGVALLRTVARSTSGAQLIARFRWAPLTHRPQEAV